MTQAEIAHKIGASRNTYSMIERGERDVTVSNAKK